VESRVSESMEVGRVTNHIGRRNWNGRRKRIFRSGIGNGMLFSFLLISGA